MDSRTDRDLAEALASGDTIIWCDSPPLIRRAACVVEAPLRVAGWAYRESGVRSVFVLVDGRHRCDATHGQLRADLPAALGRIDAINAGFSVTLGRDLLTPGDHTLSVLAIGADGVGTRVDGTIRVLAPGAVSAGAASITRPIERTEANERLALGELPAPVRELERLARYRWAAGAAVAREVLDIACGDGRGSHIIAAAGATRVVGIDEHEAVHGTARKPGAKVEFLRADFGTLPFADDSFDMVVWWDALAHECRAAVEEVRRILRPSAMLLISTTAAAQGERQGCEDRRPTNLIGLLQRRFANVEVWAQRTRLCSLLTATDASVTEDARGQIVSEVHASLNPPGGSATTWAIAATDRGSSPLLATSVLGDVLEAKAWLDSMRALEDRALVAEADAVVSRMNASAAQFAAERAMKEVAEAQRARLSAEQRLAHRRFRLRRS